MCLLASIVQAKYAKEYNCNQRESLTISSIQSSVWVTCGINSTAYWLEHPVVLHSKGINSIAYWMEHPVVLHTLVHLGPRSAENLPCLQTSGYREQSSVE